MRDYFSSVPYTFNIYAGSMKLKMFFMISGFNPFLVWIFADLSLAVFQKM